jgi:hypothetical protein
MGAVMIERIANRRKGSGMNDETWTLAGWSGVPVFLTLAVTPVLTTLVMSLPVSWLFNHIFAANSIHAIFGVERLGYWRVVGLFTIVFAAQFKVKFQGPSK